MGSGYGGIYKGTFGDHWVNGPELNAVAPAIRDLTPAQVAAISAALGGLLVLDEVGLPDFAATFAQLEDSIRGAVGSGSIEGLSAPAVDEPTASSSDIAWLAEAVLSVRLLTWAASKVQELGIDASLDDNGGPTGIYENCKVAEAALNALYPSKVPGAHEGEVTTRFAFHEEEGVGGHFGVNVQSPAKRRKRANTTPIYAIERCSEIGGRFVSGIELFLLLGRGGKLGLLMSNRNGDSPLPAGTGMNIKLEDRVTVTYRWSTGTKGSSAIEISGSNDSRVSNHKIHFYENDSPLRAMG